MGTPIKKTQNEISIITSGDLTEAWNHGEFFKGKPSQNGSTCQVSEIFEKKITQ
jgi:hypothetical protein